MMGLEEWGYVATYNQPGSTDGTKENYKVQITIPYQSFMNLDFSDIRFVASDNQTLLSYNLVSYTASTSATFDVKIPTLPASPSNYQLFIYAGNSTAIDGSNPSNVFTKYDNFDNNSLDPSWTINAPVGSVTESTSLDVNIPNGVNGDWYTNTKNSPICYTEYPSIQDFSFVVKLNDYTVNTNTHAGVLLYLDRYNAYLFGRYSTNQSGTWAGINLESIISNSYQFNIKTSPTTVLPLWLKITKIDMTYTFSYSTTEKPLNDDFVVFYTTSSLGFSPSYLGVFVKDWITNPGVSARFNEFKLYPTTTNEPITGTLGSWEQVSPPVANFTSNVVQGSGPLTVTFTDSSTNSPTSWFWDFGDGGNSIEQNPSHIYNDIGTYTVSLTASKGSLTDTETKTNYITITNLGTTLFCDNPITPFYETVALNATLLDSQAIPISNETLTFTIAGTQYTATTNTSGVATINYTIPDTLNIGKNQYLVSFAGTELHPATNATGIITVERLKTLIASQNYEGIPGQTIQLKATLLDDDEVPMVGKTVNFYIPTISKTPIASATTNELGIAEVSYIIPNF